MPSHSTVSTREDFKYPTLGSFGVIATELYTGSIDVDRDAFEYDDADTLEAAVKQARGLSSEELLAHVCNEICRRRFPEQTQEELDAVCEKCALERLAGEADDREFRIRETAKKRLDGFIQEFAEMKVAARIDCLEYKARACVWH